MQCGVLRPAFYRLLFLLLILFACGGLAEADGDTGEISRSVALVFDLSYSMHTIDPGTDGSRFALGIRAVEELSKGAGQDEEWALLLSDDAGMTVTAGGFTTDHSTLVSKLEDTEPWGTTSLEEMVRSGIEQLTSLAGGSRRYLVLVTDAINTDGSLYGFPNIDASAGSAIFPVVLGFPVSEYDGFQKRAADWIKESDGVFLLSHQVDRLRHLLETGEMPETTAPQVPVSREKTTLFFPIWWIFLIPVAAAGVFLVLGYLRWSAKRKVIRNTKIEPREVVTLSAATHDGEIRRWTFDSFPVKVAGSGNADLVLDKPRISSGPRTFSVVKDDAGFRFKANGPLVINGVGRRNIPLSGGERITFGRYRLVYEGVSYPAPPRIPLPSPHFLYLLLPAIIFPVLAILFREPVALTRFRKQPVIETAQPAPPGIEPALSGTKIDTFPTVMWEPGAQPNFFKVDVLLFHAHPDDESLDFGVLLRRLYDAGKRTAVVVFTDGEAGLDQYPRRYVGDGYPAYDLRGDALSTVRSKEARSAMSILGVSHYVRLGLANSPYGGVSDVRTISTVTEAWGGKESVVQLLTTLIAGYKPDIVVSPDKPSAALEHFEHETVGMLVGISLEELKKNGGFIPAARLVSIDPLQKEHFPGAVGIRADGIDSRCGLPYRAVQAAALEAHQTQRDASVIGVENLSGFDREYYKSLYWDLPLPIEAYLSPQRR